MPRLSILSSPASALVQAARQQPSRSCAQQLPRCLAKTATRSFSNLPSLRPTLLQPQTSSMFRSSATPLAWLPATTTSAAADAALSGEAFDLAPKTSVSAHPAFAGVGSQVRFAPRPTMANASRLIQKRRHGFLSRIRTKKGRNTLTRRSTKGRKRLSA
ncbi:hypothetical protein B0T22DRAFT_481981 [Podospora appendiculata]|uniref:Mitochondrial LSU ribosomal protein L34 n=1 Tax=Podospora appendiculata TaxID=314037 RepID=A0AAE1C9Z1_9PEZI|nr:hypothetical protein B0T22DRAFT_481981 [Podospora appendiculata]